MSFVNVEPEIMDQMVANTGETLREMSHEQPVMLVFLRQFGCTFCREALSDISKKRKEIEGLGMRLVFVHMTDNEIAERYFQRYELEEATHISDPDCKYYAAFGLVKNSITQLFGLQFFIRGFQAAVLEGHVPGPSLGDDFQMPGVFIIQDGEIRESFIHKLAYDRPDYTELAKCCAIA
ncbi:MAG: SelL-related redox protein [Saprospiraceae bacterium]